MILANGVTGFFDPTDNQPIPVDEKQFKQLCHSIVKSNNGTFKKTIDSAYPMNFYHAHISFNTEQLHVLLNKHYPLLAFASSVEYESIEFIDIPHLVKPFSSFYKVLHTEELKQPVIVQIHSKQKHDFLQNNHDLNLTELKNIKYWKPKIIGEIIFNYWD